MKKIICWAALVLALCLPVCALGDRTEHQNH